MFPVTREVSQEYDAVLIGAGIMSATLGALLSLLEPTWRIGIFERLSGVAQESSNPWNNAGTGHAALCELNYTPERADGSIDIAKAITINEQFVMSRKFWAGLTNQKLIQDTDSYLAQTPHMTFVTGEDNVDYLRRRHSALREHPLFSTMEFSQDATQIAQWAPLLMKDRKSDLPMAATRVAEGTDVNFGALTHQLIDLQRKRGAQVHLNHEATALKQSRDGSWQLTVKNNAWNAKNRRTKIRSKFVFVGAGGHALPVLQRSGIKEIRGFGGFPISGKFLRTDNPELVAAHNAKVYGKADVGSPPMSVPHLDTRVVDGRASLLFGPYAGFSSRYLKKGSLWDLVTSIRPGNIRSMLGAGVHNIPLTTYLIGELAASPEDQFATLQKFMPSARRADWYSITAGQRVQVIKKDAKDGGKLEFGTSLVAAADGSIAGILGASPGASTAVSAMIELLATCFPDKAARWQPELEKLIPGLAAK